jgi:hypothetical protein
MDKDKQRIAIAEACGWEFTKVKGEFCFVSIDPEGAAYRTNFGELEHLPDYLNDLNAMHEAEKVLTDEQFFDWSKDKHTDMSYNGHLFRIVDRATTPARPCRYHSASAAQRAEAFLRTIGKWEE